MGIYRRVVTAVAITTLSLSSMVADELKGRGASFPGPLYKAWTSEYYNATKIKVNYTTTGNGKDGYKGPFTKEEWVDFGRVR